VVAALLTASRAHAQAPASNDAGRAAETGPSRSIVAENAVRWDAPPACPNRDEVTDLVRQLLGRDGDDESHVTANARVRRTATGWELTLVLATDAGVQQSTLTAVRCQALAEAVALQVALAINPMSVVDVFETREPSQLEPPSPRWPPSAGLRGAVRGAGGAVFGFSDGARPGAALLGALAWPAWRLELGLASSFLGEVHDRSAPEAGGRLTLFTAEGRFCQVSRAGSLEIPACVGAQVGAMRGSGFGLAISRTDTRPWVALLVGPALRWHLGANLALWLEVDAIVPVVRPAFRIENLGELYRAPGSGAATWAGVEAFVW
jgi:hypothetical protein